jgi:DNA-binding transcriptional LysR family regulator
MDRFQALTVFAEVAERGGFAAAARSLSLSPPAVTRAISALEQRMATRLFVRTTRSVRLTESGQRFLVDARRILSDLAEAEDAAIGSHAAPRGILRVTAPVLFGCHYVTPILADFLTEQPLVDAETLFVDRLVNLVEEGLDVAIRIGELPDSTLTAIRVGTVRRVVCASRDYFAARSRPSHPDDLENHRLIQSLALGQAGHWDFQDGDKIIRQRIRPRIRTNTNDAATALARRDWGMTQILSYQAAPHIADGELELVLEDFATDPLPIHVVHHEGRMVSAKIRSFVDYFVERLRADPMLK